MSGRIVYLSDVPASDEVALFQNEPDIMNVAKVAEILGVVPATVRREIARGRLKCSHVGSSVRVTKTALLRYVGELGDGADRLGQAIPAELDQL